ncbi:MAG: hypothetical protein AAF467_11520 [Actinomycetota bacterium]
MSTYQPYDFSSNSIPDSWTEAAQEAPTSEEFGDNALHPGGPVRVVPHGHRMDLSAAIPGTTAALAVVGTVWVLLYGSGVTTPWFALVLGATAAFAVRATGGPLNPAFRGVLAACMYFVALAVVVGITVSITYAELYGGWPSLAEFEDQLLFVQIRKPDSVVAWIVGGIIAFASSRFLS